MLRLRAGNVPVHSKLLSKIRHNVRLGSLGKELPGTPVSPADVTVRILDAHSGGKAAKVAAYFQKAGFLVLPVTPAPRWLGSTTVLLWAPAKSAEEGVVSAYLQDVRAENKSGITNGADVTLSVGPDFHGIPG